MVSRPALILASASPRRREILAALGVDFEAIAPEVEELGEGVPEQVVIENALRKARAVAAAAADDALVLGVDTDVVVDGRILGKARDAEGARRRLAALSGRDHEVLSGVALVGGGEPERTALARSVVTFRALDRTTVERYLASGEWRGRAGAYAIQGLGSTLVERLEGDFSNVVGLPVGTLLELAPRFAPQP